MLDVTRRRRPLDIWPAYVDALSSLLLVVIFVVLVFTLGHFVLSTALRGKEQTLEQLNVQVAELARLLSMEKVEAETLRGRLSELTASLRRTENERDNVTGRLATAQAELETGRRELEETRARITGLAAAVERLTAQQTELESEGARTARALEESRAALAAEKEESARGRADMELLNRQLAALREQLTEVSAALQLSKKTVQEQELRIADLGERLNVALASKVQELARYRSEFFGRLREALGERKDILIVGDRFVFQSELLFDTASAELGPGGRIQVERLVRTLKEVAQKIPADIDWVLQVDGHTDRRPIHSEQFPSNWELSTARALAIVRYAIQLGIPPERLAANGFAEFHPLDPSSTELAYARNRRIEVKLTSR
jgi:chemotaxis protein MotB